MIEKASLEIPLTNVSRVFQIKIHQHGEIEKNRRKLQSDETRRQPWSEQIVRHKSQTLAEARRIWLQMKQVKPIFPAKYFQSKQTIIETARSSLPDTISMKTSDSVLRLRHIVHPLLWMLSTQIPFSFRLAKAEVSFWGTGDQQKCTYYLSSTVLTLRFDHL